jgi:hypothetical protein
MIRRPTAIAPSALPAVLTLALLAGMASAVDFAGNAYAKGDISWTAIGAQISPETYLDIAHRWAEFRGADGDAAADDLEETYGPLPLAHMKYQVIGTGWFGTFVTDYTDENGHFEFSLTADQVNRAPQLVFYAEHQDGRKVQKPVRWPVFGFKPGGPHASFPKLLAPTGDTAMEIVLDPLLEPINRGVAGGTLMLFLHDRFRAIIDSARPHISVNPPDAALGGPLAVPYNTPNLVYGIGYANDESDASGAYYSYESPYLPYMDNGFNTFHHELGHVVLNNILHTIPYVRINWPYSGDHTIGGQISSVPAAFNESWAHFIAGVGLDVPNGGVYHKQYYDWMISRSQIDALLYRPDPKLKATQIADKLKYYIRKMKKDTKGLRLAVDKYRGGDLNQIEGYATEFFNEIYFSGLFDKPEALGKLMSAINLGWCTNIDCVLEWWLKKWPGDESKLAQIKLAVDENLYIDPLRIADEFDGEVHALELELFGAVVPDTGSDFEPAQSYIPGGFAVCWDCLTFVVTDNTGGRILLITTDGSFPKYVTLVDHLSRPGDVDIGTYGRSFTFADGGEVHTVHFGLTALVQDEYGKPVSGAEVVVEYEAADIVVHTDERGLFTVMDLLRPTFTTGLVTLTVDYDQGAQQFEVLLSPGCQTRRTLVYVGGDEGEGEDEEGEGLPEGEGEGIPEGVTEGEGEGVPEGEGIVEGEGEGVVEGEGEGTPEGEGIAEGEGLVEGEGEGVPEGEGLLEGEGEGELFFEVTISVQGQGTTNPAPDVVSFHRLSLATIEAIPEPGWRFSHWEGDAAGSDNPIELLMDKDLEIVAVFVPDLK